MIIYSHPSLYSRSPVRGWLRGSQMADLTAVQKAVKKAEKRGSTKAG